MEKPVKIMLLGLLMASTTDRAWAPPGPVTEAETPAGDWLLMVPVIACPDRPAKVETLRVPAERFPRALKVAEGAVV